MDFNDIDNEDEDVIVKGSSLYEHLHKLGYTDFESVTIEKLMPKRKEKNFTISGFVRNIKNAFKKLYIIYLGIIQDDNISHKQVGTILNAKVLLNDHGCEIQNFLHKYDCKPWRTVTLKLILFGTVLSSSMYVSYSTRYKNPTNLFIFTVLYCAAYMKHLRVNAHKDLKSLVSLQNDLIDFCKKGMKILKYGYKIKLNRGKSSQQYSDLIAGRLKYLQPILENVVKYLEHTSCSYYQASLILVKMLPVNICKEDLLTRFDSESFRIHGEINYQKLKTLYHIYILTQSEMLHLLAVAYDNRTWRQSYKKIPESKLAYIVRILMTHLRFYKNKLAKEIDAYYSFKLEPIAYKYRGPDSSQWQDLYMHLYLASNKLQLAYGHVLSILQDIDNDAMENIANGDSMESTMKKLNAAQKSIETAKDFVEFSSLFLVKTQMNGTLGNRLEVNVPASNANPDVRIVTDSEPEIMDEVFEEYIKEEYLKPLSEESDEILLYSRKRDKTFKNFMTELKDALVDKKKSMAERELKALQRMRKTTMKENAFNDQPERIPTPPPMPSFNAPFLIQNDNLSEAKKFRFLEKPNITKSINEAEENLMDENVDDITMEEKSPISAIPLPRNIEFPAFVPPSFLKEETFIGSGENSEDETTEEAKTESKIMQ